jgi:hypothetical protein
MRRMRNVRAAFALLTSLFATIGLASGTPPPKSGVLGDWKGAIDTGNGSLHVVFHLFQEKDGRLTGTMDSPDQGATGIPVSSATYTKPELRITFEKIGSTYEGKVGPEERQIVGVWKQGTASLPLTLDRAGK